MKQEGVFPAFERLFLEHGLPHAIRTDNGNPFATRAIAGLSALNVWWIKLGVGHQRIEPGQPQQNGRHERMHRTLKAETTRPPEPTMQAQQERFDLWQRQFNTERFHEALDGATPASVYRPSVSPEPAPDARACAKAGVSSTPRGALGLECRDGPVQEAAVLRLEGASA